MSRTGGGPTEEETCRDFIVPALEAAGWDDDTVVEQRYITDGRIMPIGGGHRRAEGLRVDYLLEPAPGQPLAVVEAKREYKRATDGLQQAMRYAEMLGVGFAYASNGDEIAEHDYDTGRTRGRLASFPSPDQLWARHLEWKGVSDPIAAEALALPFNRDLRNPDGSPKEPRYYQSTAINLAVERILAGDDRNLITMATGTGKTFVALQVVWKLRNCGWTGERKPRILYLADRNILVDQPIDREFRPVFGDAVWKLQGEGKTGREIYFALYQSLTGTTGAEDEQPFESLPSDYFDLVVVDECHRGSARGGSTWRAVLDHFSPASQLGMTATPLRDDNVDTYEYFGDPIFEYSLAQGIDDGFLAPYRVKRVVLSPDAYGWKPDPDQIDRYGREIPEGVYGTAQFERVVSLLDRTKAAARNLTDHLRRSGRMDKTIVFCVDSEHAEQMRLALAEENADLVRQFPHYVARIVSDEGSVGREHLGSFADPERETPVIVTTSKLLSTGVDVPTCRNVVLFRPVGSMVEFKQIIGRGTRLAPDQDKLWFQIIDYSGATANFSDPEFDGKPELIEQETIGVDGDPVAATEVESPEPSYEPASSVDQAPLPEEIEPRSRKYYVDGSEVFVTAESLFVLEPGTDRLRVIDYREYAAEQVRRICPRADDLRGRWRQGEGRDEVVTELESRGVDLDELASRAGLTDADPFDLLVHIAWNGPLMSRRDRVNRLRRDQGDYMASFSAEARQVLDALLDKYADHGISQLDDLAVLEVPPLSEMGTVVEIADHFGGAQKLRDAARELGDHLYAA